MRVDNTAFTAKNVARTKLARYTVEIAFDSAATDLHYFTSHPQAESAVPAGATVAYNVVESLSGTSQQINPDEARATIGTIQFSLVDKSVLITSLFNVKLADGKGLKGKRVRVYLGYEGLTFSEYSLIQTQIIDSASFTKAGYHIRCADVNRTARKDIFDPKKTTLSASVDVAQLLIPVFKVSGFTAVAHGPSYSDAPNRTVGYIRIEDEVIRWTGTTTDPVLGLCFVADLRGALNTVAAAHTIDATATPDRRTQVLEYIYLEMPAVKLAYAILTGQLHGQGAALPNNWHLAIPTSFVRLSDFTGIGADWWDTANDTAGFLCRFEGLEKQDGKAFLEKELYILLGAFSPIYASGELGLKRMTGVLSGASHVVELNHSNIVSFNELTHDMQKVINQIQINWNWEALEKRFTRSDLLIDAESINTHGPSVLKTLNFRGLHGSRHSFGALANRFSALRDRYAGPPILCSIRCLPRLNTIEVGDVVRVNAVALRDYTNSVATLVRAFEVQGVSTDWITGDVTLNLFGSSQKASPIAQNATAAPPLSDSWYNSEGTSLKDYIQSTYGVAAFTESGGVGTIAQDVTLPGGVILASGIYYYLGDLIVAAGKTVTVTQNLQLRVKGHITVNGKIDGKGRGLAGTSALAGQVGFLGTTQSGGGMSAPQRNGAHVGFVTSIGSKESPLTIGIVSKVPNFEVSTVGGVLAGIPIDLRGTSGGCGGALTNLIEHPDENGGDGGAGGAGFMIICRGASFGANGLIDLSGNNGALPAAFTLLSGEQAYPGTGAGGAPGACVVFLDGANSNIPDLGATLNSSYGATSVQGNAFPDPYRDTEAASPAYSYYTGISGIDMGQAASRVQFLPDNAAAADDSLTPPSNVTGFSAAQNGQVVVFRWNRILDFDRDGYEIRYHILGTPTWESGVFLTREARGTEITSASIPPGSWTMLIKAIDLDGNYSVNAASFNITVSNTNDIIFQQEQAPTWDGEILAYGDAIFDEDGTAILDEAGAEIKDESAILSFIRHWSGVLIPNSQDPAELYAVLDEDRSAILDEDGTAILDEGALDFLPILDEDGADILDEDGTMLLDEASIAGTTAGVFELFDTFVVNPVPTSEYEAREKDTGFDSTARVWSQVSATLGPGQAGSFDILRSLDFRLSAGIYDGFEAWTVGAVTARFFKQKFALDNTKAIGYVTSFLPTVDLEERSEEGINVIVAAGGTSITYAQKFHNAPNVQISMAGPSPLIPLVDEATTEGFTARVVNSAGTGIGGTVNWRATGA